MLVRFVAMFLLILSCAAHAQESPDSLTITTRSTGWMFASDIAQWELGLPDGRFDYELVYTSTFERSRIESRDPLSLFAPGKGTVTLTVGGASHTFRDFEDWMYTAARFRPASPFGGGTEAFEHSAYIGSYYGIGLTGGHVLWWPPGRIPDTLAFTGQSWVFDGPAVGDVHFNLEMGGERVGYFTGTATHFEMTISAVPEPSRLALLLAGLAVAGLGARLRRNRRDAVGAAPRTA